MATKTAPEPKTEDTAAEWYAPNQQAVRADTSGPAEEGNGGEEGTPAPQPPDGEPEPAPEPEPTAPAEPSGE